MVEPTIAVAYAAAGVLRAVNAPPETGVQFVADMATPIPYVGGG